MARLPEDIGAENDEEFATRRLVERIGARGTSWTRATLAKAFADAYEPIPDEPACDAMLIVGPIILAYCEFGGVGVGVVDSGWGMPGHARLMQWREVVEFARENDVPIKVADLKPRDEAGS
jgi:hypothetical protein